MALPEWSVPEPSEAGELQFADVQVEKFTVPVGVPVPEDLATVAEKTTVPPNTDGFGKEVSKVVVAMGAVTTWVTTFDVLPEDVVTPADLKQGFTGSVLDQLLQRRHQFNQ